MNPDTVLLELDGQPWTVHDSLEGTHIFGSNGSGKSKGSGRAIAEAFLRAGYGGLVLTVKADEADAWQRYMEDAGRTDDLIRVRPEFGHRFNFLDHEATRSTRGGGLTQNITSLFLGALDDPAVRTADPYWQDNMRMLLGHATDVCRLAGGVTLQNLVRVIVSAPTSRRADVTDSFCARLLKHALARHSSLNANDRYDLDRAIEYFGKEFADLNEKTRSIIVSCFTSKADGLLRAPHRAIFAEPGEPTFTPELSHRGKVIVLDLPVHQFWEAGRFAQCLYKSAWQRAANQRGKSDGNLPLFLWCDEAHHFLSDTDATFQSTCRDYRVATVCLAQNLPNYFNLFGARNPEQGVMGFLGCLRTKIFHQNVDDTTNRWAEELFASEEAPRQSTNIGDAPRVPGLKSLFDAGGGALGRSTTYSFEQRPRVAREDFVKLRTPQKPDLVTNAIVYYRNGQVLRHSFPIRTE